MTLSILKDLLAVPSPTFSEEKKVEFIKQFLINNCLAKDIITEDNNLLYQKIVSKDLPTVALVAHSDVVPTHKDPYEKNGLIYGAGASDMQAGLAAFLSLLSQQDLILKYNIVLIVYAREEGTSLDENGLASVIKTFPEIIQTIDCAIVGEPTDNTIQLGCMGSCHAKVTIFGKEAHSARPWNGENALYKSLPIIQKLSEYKGDCVVVETLEFKEVMSITECTVDPGRTSIPGTCSFNINYRFGPNKTSEEAFQHVSDIINSCGVSNVECELVDSVYAGKIIKSQILDTIIKEINKPIQAKQAWTDVAQLAEHGISCFNFGPGLQSQAHKETEYADINLYHEYEDILITCLTKGA